MTTTKQELIRFATTNATQRAARLDAIAEEFKAAVDKNGLAYSLSWAESMAVETFQARTWAAVVSISERDDCDFETALAAVVGEERDALLSNRDRCSSSSQFSNATEAAQREARSRFVREAGAMLSSIQNAEAE